MQLKASSILTLDSAGRITLAVSSADILIGLSQETSALAQGVTRHGSIIEAL